MRGNEEEGLTSLAVGLFLWPNWSFEEEVLLFVVACTMQWYRRHRGLCLQVRVSSPIINYGQGLRNKWNERAWVTIAGAARERFFAGK